MKLAQSILMQPRLLRRPRGELSHLIIELWLLGEVTPPYQQWAHGSGGHGLAGF